MYLYDNFKRVKSIDDLNVGDLLFFSIETSYHIYQKKLNSEWIVISKIDNKRIVIRNKYGKQIITLTSIRILDGFIKIKINDKLSLTFNVLFKKRYLVLDYIKLNLNKFLEWIF